MPSSHDPADAPTPPATPPVVTPPAVAPPAVTPADDAPVLPNTTSDQREVGWGDDDGRGDRDARWYEEQRPPHWE